MTPNEFKAWFDGFTEAFDGRIPTKAQWGRIKDRVAEIDGKAVTERVYVDRYWPQYVAYPSYPRWHLSNATCSSTLTANSSSQNLCSSTVAATAFNSLGAMNDFGRAEAKSLAS